MSLSSVFGQATAATVIFRGDGRIRGYQGSAALKPGGWFELPLAIGPYAFRADSVIVKSAGSLTQDDFRSNANGNGIMPLIPGDEGSMIPDEACTVVKFSPQTGRPIPPAFYAVSKPC